MQANPANNAIIHCQREIYTPPEQESDPKLKTIHVKKYDLII